MPKASIVISIYNVEGYVRKGIVSAIHQTQRDIEILLVDDGSTDGSAEICDQFAAEDIRIRVIHKKNGGLSSARNAGTQAATAEYIMFLDGDDYLREDAVERCLNVMHEYPCAFVQYLYQEVNEEAQPIIRQSTESIYQAESSRELFENLYRLGGVAASGATKFMRRSLALEIPFEAIWHEDEMWCTRAFERDLTITYVPEELYYYVMRKGSIIRGTFNARKLDAFTVSAKRIEALSKLQLRDLLSREYGKMFGIILTLFKEAHAVKDRTALKIIEDKFHLYKDNIGKHATLSRKFRILFTMMKVNYRAIYAYDLYWRVKEDE